MSTRSTLTIKSQTSKINFYRHMDGYLAGAGIDLLTVFSKVKDTSAHNKLPAILKAVSDLVYKDGRAIYEVIDSPSMHSDREFHYTVTVIDNDIHIRIEEFDFGKHIGKTFFQGSVEKLKHYFIEEKIV